MARTWLSITVELLAGRGEQLWPFPGRVFAVGPAHTFADLADAINTGFARWDRAHLDLFTLADGSLSTNETTGMELTGSGFGGIMRAYDIEKTKVASAVKPGEEFKFTFDLGDDWVHRCVVDEDKVDPIEVLGIRPKVPLPYWGWGNIPDQYGRRTADDDGESALGPEPTEWHPMVGYGWPPRQELPALDPHEVRTAVAARDVEAFLDAVAGREIEHALQQIAAGLPMVLERQRAVGEPVALAVYNRLMSRTWVGDEELAQDLLARLRQVPLEGTELPVDLHAVATLEAAGDGQPARALLDLTTGEVQFDTGENGPDLAPQSGRWLNLEPHPAGAVRQDMEDFTASVTDDALRDKLHAAIQGKGALTRFRDVARDSGLEQAWQTFSTDRALGRVRALLAQEGIRVR